MVGRSGHLFENRYKSILCDEENYLPALVRYIHLNPLRAGIIRILGNGDFVQEILKEAEEKYLRQFKLRQSGLNIVEMIRQECKKSKISPEELKRGSRRRRVSGVRAAIACRSSKELGFSGAEIARHLGVNTSSINRAIACVKRPG